MRDILKQSSIKAARGLLGHFLCRRIKGKIYKFIITETEAYEGFADMASHAHRGKTKRNEPMFSSAGTIYVYFTYGMHYMLNIVSGKEGHPSAVLIRGVEGISGPGRLTKKLKIDRSLNNKKLSKQTGLWLERNRDAIKIKVKRTPRIGIHSSGPIWSNKPYRFIIMP